MYQSARVVVGDDDGVCLCMCVGGGGMRERVMIKNTVTRLSLIE